MHTSQQNAWTCSYHDFLEHNGSHLVPLLFTFIEFGSIFVWFMKFEYYNPTMTLGLLDIIQLQQYDPKAILVLPSFAKHAQKPNFPKAHTTIKD